MGSKKNLSFIITYFPALTTGLMLTAAFPDSDLFYLAFAALVPLLVSMESMTVRQCFFAGFVAGFSHFMTLIYWIVPTVTIYGGLHPLLAISVLTLLCLYLALYLGGFALLLKKLDPPPGVMPLGGACVWVGLEYIRTHALTGFPWGVLGYSQHSNRLLVQAADLTGVLGLSFILVVCNFCLARLVLYIRSSRPTGTGKALLAVLSYTLILVAVSLAYGRARLQAVDLLIQAAAKPRICVVQGNIRQDLKWDKSFKEATLERYGRLSLASVEQGPDLIIWPETAMPFYYGYDKVYSDQVDAYIQKAKTHFLIGSPALETTEGIHRFYNRAYMVNPLSQVTATYDKNHLVPFGEYVPLEPYLSFLGKITAQAGNFSTGDKSFTPLAFKDHKTGVLICFEILFPGIAAEFVKNGADLLTTMTNDAWFGYTSAARQHFSIAVLRAVETRRSVVRAANTGISGFIDPTGQAMETTRLFTTTRILQPVPALSEISFYTLYGDLLAIAALVAICLGFMVKGINKIMRRS